MMYSWSYFLVYANERTCAVLRVNQIEKPYAINALIEKPYRINNAPYSRTLLESYHPWYKYPAQQKLHLLSPRNENN